MRDALTIPIGMQLPARFRNDAHTGLDSQVGRNFVIKNERHRRYFSFADVSIRKIYSSLLVRKKKKNQDLSVLEEKLVEIFSCYSVIVEFSNKKKKYELKCSKQINPIF